MTPGRLTQLRCPNCQQVTWVIDSDFREMDGVMIPYAEREYTDRRSAGASGCGGWR